MHNLANNGKLDFNLTMMEDETSLEFMDRLNTCYKNAFPPTVLGREFRIKKQFLEGFRNKGGCLNEKEKQDLILVPSLVELAIATKERVEKKHSLQSHFVDTQCPPSPFGAAAKKVEKWLGQTSCKGKRKKAITNCKPEPLAIEDKMKDMSGVCFRCAGAGHIAVDCQFNRFCRVCNKEANHTTRRCHRLTDRASGSGGSGSC